jgi:hypothetical protein
MVQRRKTPGITGSSCAVLRQGYHEATLDAQEYLKPFQEAKEKLHVNTTSTIAKADDVEMKNAGRMPKEDVKAVTANSLKNFNALKTDHRATETIMGVVKDVNEGKVISEVSWLLCEAAAVIQDGAAAVRRGEE